MPCAAATAPLRIVAPTNQTMPLLRMAGDRPAEGLLKDFGELVARKLGRTPQFVALPSKRAQTALMRGEADLHCYVKPGWLQGDLLWTRPFLASAEVVAAQGDVPPLKRLAALRGEPVGTVLGYVYPRLEAAVGAPLLRQDATDADANLRRLAAGRVRYAVTDRNTLRYWAQRRPDPALREVAVIESYELGCALSPREAGLLGPINQAIDAMLADGSWERLIAAAMTPPLRLIAPTSSTPSSPRTETN